MENKTKEHLASEHCDNLDIIGEDYNYNSFTSGYDSRQPEIDALKEERVLKCNLKLIIKLK